MKGANCGNGLEEAVCKHVEGLVPFPPITSAQGLVPTWASHSEPSSSFPPPGPRSLAVLAGLGTAFLPGLHSAHEAAASGGRRRHTSVSGARSLRRFGGSHCGSFCSSVSQVFSFSPCLPFQQASDPLEEKNASAPFAPGEYGVFRGVSYCRCELATWHPLLPSFSFVPFLCIHWGFRILESTSLSDLEFLKEPVL